MAQLSLNNYPGFQPPNKKRKLNPKSPTTEAKFSKLSESEKSSLITLTIHHDIFKQFALTLQFEESEINDLNKLLSPKKQTNSTNNNGNNIEEIFKSDTAPLILNKTMKELWGKTRRKEEKEPTKYMINKRRDLYVTESEIPRTVSSRVRSSELLIKQELQNELDAIKKYLNDSDMKKIEEIEEDIYVHMNKLKKEKNDNKSKRIDRVLVAIHNAKGLVIYALLLVKRLIAKLKDRVVNILKICDIKNNKVVPKITTIKNKNGEFVATPISPNLWKRYENLLLDATECNNRLDKIQSKVQDIDEDKCLIGLRGKKTAQERIKTALARKDRRNGKKRVSYTAKKSTS